jgi:citrate synthase
MAILSSMINAAACYYPDLLAPQEAQNFDHATAFIISQVRAIAAFAHRKSRGLPFIYPKPQYKYTPNFLHMMFSGWIANYREVNANEAGPICRPRQVYVGDPLAHYVPIDQRPA